MTEKQALSQDNAPLPTTPAALLALLDGLGIGYSLHHHAPIFTVAEGEALKKTIPGLHCRNLFLTDKKKQMVLVVAGNDTKVDLKALSGTLNMGRFSFGSPERLWHSLGIRPGSVCPFTLLNDPAHKVRLVLDAAMMQADIVNYHPLDNAMTIGLAPSDLLKFIAHTGHTPEILDLQG